jgi:Na+-translocating ferredoxin:NAD+ oxidoreductase RnfA subunit
MLLLLHQVVVQEIVLVQFLRRCDKSEPTKVFIGPIIDLWRTLLAVLLHHCLVYRCNYKLFLYPMVLKYVKRSSWAFIIRREVIDLEVIVSLKFIGAKL